MFDKIRKCLDEFEDTAKKNDITKDDEDVLRYFDLHLAGAIVEDECCDSKKIAKVILGWTGM